MSTIFQDAPPMRTHLDALREQGYTLDITHTAGGYDIAAHGPRDIAVSAPTLAQALASAAASPTTALLRNLADALEALPQARVSPPEVIRELRLACRHYRERQPALNVLAPVFRHADGFDGWLWHWTGPRPRSEVARLVREAAAVAEGQVAR